MNKVKPYAGYAGIGFLSGYITTAILFNEPLWLFILPNLDLLFIIVFFVLVISPMLGGVAGGVITRIYLGAVIGGVIADVLAYIVVFASLFWYLD